MSYMVNIIVSLSCALSFPSASLMKEKLFSFSVDSRSDLHHFSRVFSLFTVKKQFHGHEVGLGFRRI